MQENRNPKKDYWKYINIALIVVILIIGMNKFVFSNSGGFFPIGRGESLSQIGLEYYLENYGEGTNGEGVESIVKNFGCHREIHIFKEGQLVMRLSYFNGQIYEI